MNKLRLLLAGVMIALASLTAPEAKAQVADFSGKVSGPITHTNAQADTVLVTINSARSTVLFKYDISKTSGMVAGTIVLQTRTSTASGEQWATLNTYTLTDATASATVSYAYNPGIYYRIITTTSGTSVSVHNKYVLYRK